MLAGEKTLLSKCQPSVRKHPGPRHLHFHHARVHVELNDEVDDLLQGADQETKTTQNAQGGAL